MCGPIVWLALALSDALHGPILARSHLFLYFLSFTFLPHIILSFYVLYCMMHYTANFGSKVAPFLSFVFYPLSILSFFMFCLMHYAANLAMSNLFRGFLYFSFPPWLGWFGRLVFVLCTIVEIWQGRISLFLHYVTILALVFEKWFNPSNILIILQIFLFFWFSFLLYKLYVRYAVMSVLAGLVYMLFSTPKSLPICKSNVCPVCLFWSLADVALLAEFADWSLSDAP